MDEVHVETVPHLVRSRNSALNDCPGNALRSNVGLILAGQTEDLSQTLKLITNNNPYENSAAQAAKREKLRFRVSFSFLHKYNFFVNSTH